MLTVLKDFWEVRKPDSENHNKTSFEEIELVLNRPLKSYRNVLIHKMSTQYQHKF
jgi:hypothetical protein